MSLHHCVTYLASLCLKLAFVSSAMQVLLYGGKIRHLTTTTTSTHCTQTVFVNLHVTYNERSTIFEYYRISARQLSSLSLIDGADDRTDRPTTDVIDRQTAINGHASHDIHRPACTQRRVLNICSHSRQSLAFLYTGRCSRNVVVGPSAQVPSVPALN